MSKEIDDVYKEVIKNNKDIRSIDEKLSKDITETKKILKNLDKKISAILEKIEEFEVIIDAAEILQSKIDEDEDNDAEGWQPYNDDYQSEDYENYDYTEDDEDEDI